MNRVVRSILWLTGCSAVGYGLLLTITPDGRVIKEKYPEFQHSDVKKRTQDILNTLQKAAGSDKPLYRQNKEDLEKVIKKVD